MLLMFNMFNRYSLEMVLVLHLVNRIIICIIWQVVHNILFLQTHLAKHALYCVLIVVSILSLQLMDHFYLLFKILMLQMPQNLTQHWTVNQDLLILNSIILLIMQLMFAKLISLILNHHLTLKVKLLHQFTIKHQILVGFVIT